jgi:hypothetical protein
MAFQDGMYTHHPLPYAVTVRSTVDEDSAPTVRTFTVTAYSLMEALIQASFEAGGTGLEDQKHHIERVEPDLPAFLSLALKGKLAIEQALG